MDYFDDGFKTHVNAVYRDGDVLNFYGFRKLKYGVVMNILNGKIILRPAEHDEKPSFILCERSVASKELADTFESRFALGRHFMNADKAYWSTHIYYNVSEEEFIKSYYEDIEEYDVVFDSLEEIRGR